MKNKRLEQIIMNLRELQEDISVPRNIRRGAKEAIEILQRDESLDVKVASVISMLDELVNDPNIPIHGRTSIWSIMSQLESLTAENQ
ncbi:MAG: UPF0147 family protein [Thermoplasmata archaeon]|nr:MAG: UPF0147 family protein [Thermoplasmata archaeon]